MTHIIPNQKVVKITYKILTIKKVTRNQFLDNTFDYHRFHVS